jgi:hypothetical protein
MWPNMNEEITLRKLLTGNKNTELGDLGDLAYKISNVIGKPSE